MLNECRRALAEIQKLGRFNTTSLYALIIWANTACSSGRPRNVEADRNLSEAVSNLLGTSDAGFTSAAATVTEHKSILHRAM